MNLKELILLFLCMTVSGICSSCSDNDGGDDDGNELTERDNDWMLEGQWTLKNKFNDNDAVCSDITFRADGTGTADNNKFEWYTYDGRIFVSFDNGKKLNEYYSISGATLNISNTGSFVTKLPMTGTWYACNAMNEFAGNSFCYYLDENGDGIKYSFDYTGLVVKTFFKWKRSHEGISFVYRYVTENKTCNISDDTINIEGEGCFTSAKPFYGRWMSVDSNEGLIHRGDNNYSTLEITAEENTSLFVCKYKTASENDYTDASYQAEVRFVTSHQHDFDDQRIFILKDLTSADDARVIEYRFFHYPPRRKVYLDLSRDFDTKEFVRYELM